MTSATSFWPRVAGTTYLHLVSAVDAGTGRVQISNNRGRINGWIGHDKVYGICTAVEGVTRPHLAGKIRQILSPAVETSIVIRVRICRRSRVGLV